jgi:hypothetical protein
MRLLATRLNAIASSIIKRSFTPLSLFSLGEQGAWYDPSDLSTLFQDSVGTTPVTAVGQPVGRMLDKSGRGNTATQATTTNRPTLQQDPSGQYYLKFDGVDDGMVTTSINFTATDKVSVFAGLRKLSDSALGMFVELSASTTTNNGTFYVAAPSSASDRYSFNSKGTTLVNALRVGFAAPVTSILTCIGSIGTDVCRISVNSTSTSTTTTDQGTGTYGNYPLYIGRRGGVSSPFNGHFYGLIIRGVESTVTEIASTEKWMANKTGVIL